MPEWGGPRPGAGRKPKEPGKSRVSFSTRISMTSSERLRAYARSSGKSLGEVLDQVIAHVASDPTFEATLASSTPAVSPEIQPAEPLG